MEPVSAGPVPHSHVDLDEEGLRVPFWIVLAGVGVGAFWALTGVAVGHWISGRRGQPPARSRPAAATLRRSPHRS